MRNGRGKNIPRWLVEFVAVVVTMVWAGAFLADVSSSNFRMDIQYHAVMLAIITGIFGFSVIREKRNDE